MEKPTIKAKKRLLLFLFCSMCGYLLLTGRLVFIELFRAEELQELAYEQQTRDRLITPKRGAILDRNGEGIALTETVNAVSVIPVQVKSCLGAHQNKGGHRNGGSHPQGELCGGRGGRGCAAHLSLYKHGGAGDWLCREG